MNSPQRRHYAAIFTISMTLLMLEIAVARILSVALYSHYAFVAVSLAMFGLGLSSLVVYLGPNHFTLANVDRHLAAYSARFALTAAVCIAALLKFPIVQELSIRGFFALSTAYTLMAIPFFLAGMCIALIMTHFSAQIGRIYFADLVGASVGCLTVVLLMEVMPAPYVALVVAVAAGVVSVVLGRASSYRTEPAITLACVLALVVASSFSNLYVMRYVKHWTEYYADYETWNAFSRISAFNTDKSAAEIVPRRAHPGEDPSKFPKTMILDIDGAAWTPMMNFNGDLASVGFLRESVLYAGHAVRPNSDVLIIGIGGGRDIIAARAFDQRSVLGIELNPLMKEVVDDHYGDYSGRPYTMDKVQVILDEARSKLHQLDRRFGVIQLSLIDTFSLNAAGGFVFSENNLYTTEAFEEYFEHLTDDGVLSVTRYFVKEYPVEILRVLTLIRAAWGKAGERSVADHVVVLLQGINCTILAKRTAYTPDELAELQRFANTNNILILYAPGLGQTGGDAAVREVLTTPDINAMVSAHPYLIGAPTDDQPFFFNFLRGRLERVPTKMEDPFEFLRLWHEALNLMYLLIAVVTVLAVVFFIGPLFVLARRGIEGVRLRHTMVLLLYFACLGYGFMMIEIPILQRFILFLGYPAYALAVVLFALLLFSGIGSLVTTRFTSDPGTSLRYVLIAIVVLSVAYAYLLPPVVEMFLGVPIALKIVVTAVLLAPIGLVLGMAYPLGIARLRLFSEGLVPWAWGLNGALSVVASVLAMFIGSRLGFTAALLTGTGAYLLAFACMAAVGRSAVAIRAGARSPTLRGVAEHDAA